LNKLIGKVKLQVTEKKFGSERSSLLLEYISEKVPKIYSKMLANFRKQGKAGSKKTKKDELARIG